MPKRRTTHVPGAIWTGRSVPPALGHRELRGLIELSRMTNGIMDLDLLLDAIMRKAAEMLRAQGASVILLDPPVGAKAPDLVFHVASGRRGGQLERFRLAWGEGYAGDAARERRRVIVNDVDTRHAKRVDEAIDFVTRSLVAVPLTVRKRMIGVLEVVNKTNGDFTADDARLCEAIANHVAVAIERARLAEENLRNQKLAAIGQTIAGTAHCIKNIVNALRGGEYILKSGFRRGDLAKAQSGWAILEDGMGRISTLALDMLAYVKNRRPQRAPTDVRALVAQACTTIRESARSRGVHVALPRGGPLTAPIDATGIQRCVMNLLTNAVDACADQDKGLVRAGCRKVAPGEVEIRIEDNGPGIPEEIRRTLFDPFVSTKGSQGTGLGLSVTQKIIEEHGGAIAVTSAPDQGAAFTIRLPVS